MSEGEWKPPPSKELEHFGIPGMHWGNRKAQQAAVSVPRRITYTDQVAHAVRNKVGAEATRAILKNYGGDIVKFSGKAAVTGTKAIFSQRAARGSGIVLKMLGKSAKVGGKVALKGGKVYLKTALALAKYGLRAR